LENVFVNWKFSIKTALQIFFNNKLSLSYIKNCFFMKLTSIFASESKNYKNKPNNDFKSITSSSFSLLLSSDVLMVCM
jgi:hypothetical protein